MMEDAYEELRHTISIDERFVHLALDIERHLGILDRVTKVRVKSWLSKLREQTRNLTWKKNRNLHAKLLLEQLRCGKLEPPFHVMPPQGGLPTLPTWMTYRFLSPPRSRSVERSAPAAGPDLRTRASVDMHLYRMSQSPGRSRSASPPRTGIFAWPSSPRTHSHYTALAEEGAAWREHERAMSPGRLPQSVASDLYPGRRARSPVIESAAVLGSAVQAELDASHYGSKILEQRLAAAEARLYEQAQQLDKVRSHAKSQKEKMRWALDDVITRYTWGSNQADGQPHQDEDEPRSPASDYMMDVLPASFLEPITPGAGTCRLQLPRQRSAPTVSASPRSSPRVAAPVTPAAAASRPALGVFCQDGLQVSPGSGQSDGAALVHQVKQLKTQAQDLLVRMSQLRTSAWHSY